jgi:TP901 family phage tail tape measure protein
MSGNTTRLVFELFGRDNASPVFDRFGHRVRSAEHDVDAFGRRSRNTQRDVLGLASAFKVAGPAIATLGLAKMAVDSVKLEASFSKTMRQVQVQTKASASEVEALDALAMKMGADTVFSANDAGGAMLELAKGGLSEAQIQAGALGSTMTLAAAGSIDLAEAGGNVVDTMGAFELKAKDTDAAVSALAGAANASSADVSDMTQALAQAGAQAHASGMSVEETTAMLAALANAGIKGSDAGTALKTMFQRLTPTTQKQADLMKELNLSFVDANGNFVGAEQIAGRLHTAFKDMDQAERASTMTRLFGSDASRAANILMLQGEDGIKKYIKATSDKNAAEELAKTSMEGTSGALEQMSGAIETAQIRLGKALAPTVEDAANSISDFVSDAPIEEWAENAVDGLQDFAAAMEPIATSVLPAVTDAAGGALDVLELLVPMVGDTAHAFGSLPDAAQQAALLGGAVLLLGRRAQTMGAGVGNAVMNLRTMPDEMRNAAVKAAALRGGIGAAGIGMSMFADKVGQSNETLGDVTKVLGNAAVGFAVGGPWGAAVGAGIGLLQAFGDSNKHAVADVDELTGSLDKQTGALTANARQQVQAALEKDGAFKAARTTGSNLGDVTDAALGNEGAQKRVNAQLKEYVEIRKRAAEEATRARAGLGEFASQEDLDAADDAVNAADDAYNTAKKAADKLNGSLNAQNDVVGEAKKKWDNLNDSTSQSRELNKLSAEQIRNVAKATDGIPRSVVSKFTQPGYQGAVKNVVDIARKYNLTPKQVKTTMRTLDYSSADIRKVLRLMKDADGSRANPKVSVDTGDSVSKINLIQRTINGMHGKTVRVAVQGGTGGGITSSADGNILFFADGGTRDRPNQHTAEIAPAGNTRIWNEPETGGEVYFPLAPSKRARSRMIAAEGVEMLGGVAFFADGGTKGSKSKPKEKRKKKLKTYNVVKGLEVPDAITVEDLANRDMDPTISAYDAIGQRSFSDWAGEIAAASRAERDRRVAEVKAATARPKPEYRTGLLEPPKPRRSRASQRSAEKRSRNQQIEGATVRVVDSSGRALRGTIVTRG